MTPDPNAMRQHIDHLFGRVPPEFSSAKFEIAWTDASPDKSGRHPLKHARLFSLDQQDQAVAFACEINAERGCNVYVGAALRHRHAAPQKRCTDQDVAAANATWLDIDDDEAARSAKRFFGETPPTFCVVTGTHPAPRLQYWWRLQAPITDMALLTEILKATAAHFNGDPAVTNPGRVMRLAGSIAWPIKEGRIAELTRIHPIRAEGKPAYWPEELLSAFSQPEGKDSHEAPSGSGEKDPDASDPADVKRALDGYWNPDDYQDWITVALALHKFPLGRILWLDWSKRSAKFDAQDADKKWRETEPNGRITVRSIFHRVPREILKTWARERAENTSERSGHAGFSEGGASGSSNAGSETEPPRPLFRAMPEGRDFPISAMGSTLGAATTAIEDIVQCPTAIAGQSVLGVASLAVQAHANVVIPATGQAKPASLFLLTVAPSGERKSAADHEALASVREREKELDDSYRRQMLVYRNDHDAWEVTRNKAIKDSAGKGFAATSAALSQLPQEPEKPILPHIVCPEPTVEGLIKTLSDGQPSMGIFSDEGGSFVGGHGMSDDNRLKSAAVLSQFWDGASIKRIRAGDGATVISGRRLALHIMVQPQVATRVLNDAVLADQGFLSRILVSAPTSRAGSRLQREANPASRPALQRFSSCMLDAFRMEPALAENTKNSLNPRSIELDQRAQKTWREFADHVELQLGDGGAFAPIRGFANKMPEHAARIAAVLALSENPHVASIGEDHLCRGIELAEFYASEALRLFEAEALSPKLIAAEKLRRWLSDTWRESLISERAIQRLGPNEIRSLAAAKAAVQILVEHGWLQEAGPGIVDGMRVRQAWRVIRAAAQ